MNDAIREAMRRFLTDSYTHGDVLTLARAYKAEHQHELTDSPREQPWTVRVRIAVGVDTGGIWRASGCTRIPGEGDEYWTKDGKHFTKGSRITFVEADVPLPIPQQAETVEGRVT